MFFEDQYPIGYSEVSSRLLVVRSVTGSVLRWGSSLWWEGKLKKYILHPHLFLTNNVSAYTKLTYYILLKIAPAYSIRQNMWYVLDIKLALYKISCEWLSVFIVYSWTRRVMNWGRNDDKVIDSHLQSWLTPGFCIPFCGSSRAVSILVSIRSTELRSANCLWIRVLK